MNGKVTHGIKCRKPLNSRLWGKSLDGVAIIQNTSLWCRTLLTWFFPVMPTAGRSVCSIRSSGNGLVSGILARAFSRAGRGACTKAVSSSPPVCRTQLGFPTSLTQQKPFSSRVRDGLLSIRNYQTTQPRITPHLSYFP